VTTRSLNEPTTHQYDPDELFYSNELNNEEYNTDYDDDDE
jgi:hypothetical protein